METDYVPLFQTIVVRDFLRYVVLTQLKLKWIVYGIKHKLFVYPLWG